MFVNSNESLASASAASTTLPLRSLQEILHNRVIQKKGEIHKSHNRAYSDKLWAEIEHYIGSWLKYDATATITSCIKSHFKQSLFTSLTITFNK